VASRISSKDSFDKGVLGGCGEEVLLLVFIVLGFMGGNVGKNVETINWGRGDGGAGDDIIGAVRDVKKREVLDIVKGGPDRSGRWRILGLGRLRVDGLEDVGGDIEGAWVIPSVVRALKDLKDGGSGIRNVLLIDVVKGGPGSNGDMGEGGGGDDGGLRRSERHSILN